MEKDLNIMGQRLDMSPEHQQTESDREPLLSHHVHDGAEWMNDMLYIHILLHRAFIYYLEMSVNAF